MPMSDAEKQEFVNAYTKVLVTSWSSEEYRDRLNTEPIEALAEAGLEVPEGASVAVVTSIPEEADPSGKGHLDRQIAQWEAGEESQAYTIYVPDTPRIDMSDIDMDDLESVAGGDVNCCCCPCSCCT